MLWWVLQEPNSLDIPNCTYHPFTHPSCLTLEYTTCTFMHGFQNNLAQLLSSRSRSAIWKICSGKLKVKVTLDFIK